MNKIVTFASVLSILAVSSVPAAFATDADGNDTPGDWVVTHYKPFGLWDTICDEAIRKGKTVERCYIRYVDVFSSAPKFAAQFVFIEPDGQGYKVEFGIEPGTTFNGASLTVVDGENVTWDYDPNECLERGECFLTGDDADRFIQSMAGTTTKEPMLVSDFNDRHGTNQVLEWGISKFDDALLDFQMQSDERGLRE
ncbi:MAG: hypothetical protein ABJE63_02295 [Lentilitoribacter sp.]